MHKDFLLEKLYYATLKLYFPHEISRLLFLNCYPIIVALILKWGTRISTLKVECRNSILESGQFNLFMSDVDLLIVLEELNEIDRLFCCYAGIKKWCLNLGEVEVVTRQEFDEICDLKKNKFWPVYERIYLIKKLYKEEGKKLKAKSKYQYEKSCRSIDRIKKRVHKDVLYNISFKNVEILVDDQYLSKYLGIKITIENNLLNITDLKTFNGILSCFPAECEMYSVCGNEELRYLIFKLEFLYSKISYRYKKFYEKQKEIQLKPLERWENYLSESLRFIGK